MSVLAHMYVGLVGADPEPAGATVQKPHGTISAPMRITVATVSTRSGCDVSVFDCCALCSWEAVELKQFQATPYAEAAAAEGAAPLSFDEAQLEQAALIGFPEMLRGQLWQVACGASEARAANPGVYSELLHSAAMQGEMYGGAYSLRVCWSRLKVGQRH